MNKEDAIRMVTMYLDQWLLENKVKDKLPENWNLSVLVGKHLEMAAEKTAFAGTKLLEYVYQQCCRSIEHKLRADALQQQHDSRPNSALSNSDKKEDGDNDDNDDKNDDDDNKRKRIIQHSIQQDVILKLENGMVQWPINLPKIKEWKLRAICMANEMAMTIQTPEEGMLRFAECRREENNDGALIAHIEVGHYESLEDLAQTLCLSMSSVGRRYYTFRILPDARIEFLTYHRTQKPKEEEVFTILWDQSSPILAQMFGFLSSSSSRTESQDHLEMFHLKGSWIGNINRPNEIAFTSILWPHQIVVVPLQAPFQHYSHIEMASIGQAVSMSYTSPMKLNQMSIDASTLDRVPVQLKCPVYLFLQIKY